MLACHRSGVEMTLHTTAAASLAAPAATAHDSAAVTAAVVLSPSLPSLWDPDLCSVAKVVLDIRSSHYHGHWSLPDFLPWTGYLSTKKAASLAMVLWNTVLGTGHVGNYRDIFEHFLQDQGNKAG
jgi:hypothetical protein